MPTLKFPLVGSYNNRSFVPVGTKDQLFKGCVLARAVNKAIQSATWYAEKRLGLGSGISTPAAGKTGYGIYASPSTLHQYSIFTNAGGGIDLWDDNGSTNINCGTLNATTPQYVTFSEWVSSSSITYIMLTTYVSPTGSAGGLGWFLASDATTSLAQTGTTHSNTTVDGITSTAGYYAGQAYSGSGIAANTRIASVDTANQITLTIAASTSTTASFTRSAMAKIIDADFPSNIVGGFAELDNYINIMTPAGRVYQSDINNPASWGAANYLTVSKYAGVGVGVVRYRNQVVAFKLSGFEILYNAGNTSGSTMSSSDNAVGSTTIPPVLGSVITNANGVPYWLGADSNIYTMEGFSPKKIITLGVFASGTPSSFIGNLSSFIMNKKAYLNIDYVFGFGSSKCFWYCLDDDTWGEPGFASNTSSYASTAAGLSYFVIGDTSGKVFYLSDVAGTATFQDNGVTNTMSIQIVLDFGSQEPKMMTELRFLADVQSSGSLAVSWCDNDDGTTFTTPVNMPLTSQKAMRLTRLGPVFYGRRILKIEHSANTPCRIKAVEVDYIETKLTAAA